MSEKSYTKKDIDDYSKLSSRMQTPGVCQSLTNKYNLLKQSIPKFFQAYTGHDPQCISSFDNFIKFMHKPTDAASLGVGRMLFGKFFLDQFRIRINT